MHVMIQHTIKDAQAFWNIVAEADEHPQPDGLNLLAFYPSVDDSVAYCVYEADSLEKLRQYVNEGLGDSTQNTFIPIKSEAAMGVPV